MGEAKKRRAAILARLDTAQASGELAGVVGTMTMATVTPDMLARVNALMEAWVAEGKGKLSPSKALKKLLNAQARGCPLIMTACADCPKVRECPLMADDGNDDDND